MGGRGAGSVHCVCDGAGLEAFDDQVDAERQLPDEVRDDEDPGRDGLRDTPERVEKALRDGRFVVHGLPFTTHTELLEAEDLVRSLGYSARLTRRLGLEMPRDGKMTDVPEHTWMMATMLKHAGIDFMMIGCNGASAALKVRSRSASIVRTTGAWVKWARTDSFTDWQPARANAPTSAAVPLPM